MVFEKVRGILAEQLAVDEDEISMESLIMEDLGADSLDIVDALGTLNDEFNVDIPDAEIENIKTVGDIVKYIEENM